MKILVAVKRVADFNVRIRVKPDGSAVDLANVKMAMNPFDEIAVEEALRLNEAGVAEEVIAVSAGDAGTVETIRAALAMGADRGIHIATDGRLEPLAIAKLLAAVARSEAPGLVILGKQAVDDDAGQTGQMLSALLDWPIATFASKVAVSEGSATIVREVDAGHQTIRLTLPAVITTDLRLNQPRYASVPNIMKAKRKPIAEMTAAELGVDTTPRLAVVKVAEPPPRRTGVRVTSAAELVTKLREADAL